MSPKRSLTSKLTTRNTNKKTTVQQSEPEASEPLNDLPASSKKPRKPRRAKDKENVNPNNEETTIRLPATSNQLQEDLQSEQYAYQQNHTSSVEPTYIED
ncbi:4796_t:CDS:2 [Cetraspora pellucida]|uniref:4796_t:CDS:1 n=1 Tax=Cetraspora pellucida TaxID=1433469 RepID=A0ACA9KNM6_9GLOM|nr:4796_t:CDS:2 [Cetraspora pellucida]